jgi:Zn-dependent protease with chaperone function
MSTEASFYPAAPAGMPRGLVTPSLRYRALVLLVLISLLLFVLLYLALVAGSGLLVYWSISYPMGQISKGTLLVKGGLIAVSVMLFLFLLKGLFKRHHVDTAPYLELREDEHPALFRFLRALCRDTAAPFPRRVFVNPEVNAAVFYDSSLLSLILPVPKNLLIGLGLVNVLDLNELKAVLAHEFGHFSQTSMKVGSYVYMANRIISDLVYGRDSWDNLLREWQNADLRLAIFGWGLGGVVWALRQLLAGIFRALNLGHLALSRQMEFNADLVAVSVTGSDALIHALAKLDFANQSLLQACKDLQDASDHNVYSADLFFHQTRAAPHLRVVLRNPLLGTYPDLPGDPAARTQVFQPGKDGIPTMWATHPSNFDREENAKARYCRSLHDRRSPWELFSSASALREGVTRQWYQSWPEPEKTLTLAAPEKVQAFIDEEHAETTYHPKYEGLYDDRFVEPGELATLTSAAPHPAETLENRRATLYGETLKKWMALHRQLLAEFQLLSGVRYGGLAVNKVAFRGRDFAPGDVDRLLQQVEKDMEEDRRRLAELDRDVFFVHYQMAQVQGGKEADELLQRYRFHLKQQAMLRGLADQRAKVDATLNFLAGNTQLTEAEWNQVIDSFRGAHDALASTLREARALRVPKLKNFRGGEDLAGFLLNEPLVDYLPHEGNWIGSLLKQYALVQDRLRRLHFKSMGGILALQEQIAGAWAGRRQETAPELGAPQ